MTHSANRRSRRFELVLALGCVMASVLASSTARGQEASGAEAAATTRPAAAGSIAYATKIRPIFAQRCGSCHNAERPRGDLSLGTPEEIKEGGKSGPVIVAGQPDESLIIQRLRLPLDDRNHMPPRNRPQLTEEQIKLIEAWVAAGASFDAPAASPPPKPAQAETAGRPAGLKPQPPATRPAAGEQTAGLNKPKENAPPSPPQEKPSTADARPAAPAALADNPAPANPVAISALRAHLVYVEAVAQGSNRIRLDFAAAAKRTKDAQAVKLVEPVLQQLDGISLARCGVGDETAALLAKAPRLQRADLRNTAITDAGMASLAKLPALRELVLTQTRLTDKSVESLLAMPALERVYLWRSGLTAQAVARLRKQKARLRVEAGDAPAAKALEVEPPVKLSGDEPPPVVAAASAQAGRAAPARPEAAPALKAFNKVCPVSGAPVSAEYAVLFKSRVIGFCCNKCASQFLADPAKFENKVVAAAP